MQEFNRTELQQRRLSEFEPKKPVVQEPEHDEYYEDDEPGFFERFRFVFPVIIIAIICFIAYAWHTDKFAISRNNAELQVIKASTEPLREKPEDPGGMKIINRDKKVYDAISGKDSDKVANDTKVLPAPEEPIAHDEIAKQASSAQPEVINQLNDKNPTPATNITQQTKPTAEVNTKVENAPISLLQNTNQQTNNDTPVVPAPADSTAAAVTTENTIADIKNSDGISGGKGVKQEQPQTEKAQIKEVTAADITDVASAKKVTDPGKTKKANTGYKVQLGSYRSEGDASSSLKAMKKKFPDIIQDLTDYIEKADLGDKGIYYRLQLSGFKSESDARKVCQKLTEKKQGCFFVGK